MRSLGPTARTYFFFGGVALGVMLSGVSSMVRSEEHTSELQSQSNLVCRLLLEKKKKAQPYMSHTYLTNYLWSTTRKMPLQPYLHPSQRSRTPHHLPTTFDTSIQSSVIELLTLC